MVAVAQRGVRPGRYHNSGMPQNFIEGRCEQGFLLPPDVRDWPPADHLAWFVIDAVRGMDWRRSTRLIGLTVMVARHMSR
jgi:hypothetical protein